MPLKQPLLPALLVWALLLTPARIVPAAETSKVLLCLGDSLTAGYGVDETQAWPALLQQRLDRDLPGWRVVNAGVSGDTTADALKRLPWVLRSRPTAAFVCLGGNDGLRGQDPVKMQANLEAIVRGLQASGAKVYLGGMEMVINMGPEYRQRFHAVFPRIAHKLDLPLLPFLLTGVAGVPSLTQADGIHPTAEGHVKIAAHVEVFLLPKLKHLRSLGPGAKPRVVRSRADLQAAP